jgi:3-oxoadipate enol-lactonase
MAWSAKAAILSHGRVPYLDAGDPRSPHVLLLVHAFPVGMRVWEPVTLPEGWRALAPALPGFDGTDPPPRESTSIDDYALCIVEFMNQVGVDSAVLGGLSMGGYVGFALWRLDRLRWRGVVLADTRAGADSDQARAGREKMLQTLEARGTHGVADEMLPKLLGRTTRTERPQLVEHVRRLVERQTNEGVKAAIVRLRDRPDSTGLLAEISVPALVIVGEEDEVTPPSEAEQIQAQLQEARLVRVPQAGHLSCLENPPVFNSALASFLSAIRG